MRRKKKVVRTVRDDTTSKSKKVRKVKEKELKKKRVIKPRVKRTRNGGTWTEARYFAAISSALRDVFQYWKPAYDALRKVSRPSQNKNKLVKIEYQCATCGQWFPRTKVEIDHITPAGSLRTYEDIVPFLMRLTPEDIGAFQVLCKPDHKVKTDKENELRRTAQKILNLNV